jgi:hypothetical protein
MIAQTPILEWFHGIDMTIDIFSLIVISLIAFSIFRFYRLKKKENSKENHLTDHRIDYDFKRYKLFIISFFLLSLSFIFKLLTYFVIQYNAVETRQIGLMTITYQTVKTSDIPIFLGFFLFRILSLLSFYLLYLAYTRKDNVKIDSNNPGKTGITLRNSLGLLLVIYLLLIASYYSQSVYYVYYTTCIILLFIITESVYEIYSVNKNTNTLLLTISFSLLMLSHCVFLFLNIHSLAYVFAESIQLLAYLMLLIAFVKITFHKEEQKKIKIKNEPKKKRTN